jgi:hypothetical protein
VTLSSRYRTTTVAKQRKEKAKEAKDEVQKWTTSVHMKHSLSGLGRPAGANSLFQSTGLAGALSRDRIGPGQWGAFGR